MNMDKPEKQLLEEAKQCYYYGCAGRRICTYYTYTTTCTYPKCDKPGYGESKTAYQKNQQKKLKT
jgi:hypothetical protein